MLKYTDTQVTFREIPDEITLCINISNCPIHCPDCHSKELWEDVGVELSAEELNKLIIKNNGISCVCIMGGDRDYHEIESIAKIVISYNLKMAWYSGKNSIPSDLDLNLFNYIKVGPYIKEYGSLDNPNTNQKLYKINNNNLINITEKFWFMKKVKVINKSTNDLPEFATSGSAGMDVRAFCENNDFIGDRAEWDEESKCVRIFPGGRALIHTGLYFELPVGYELQVRPRSGLAIKNGITVLNSPGTIDAKLNNKSRYI